MTGTAFIFQNLAGVHVTGADGADFSPRQQNTTKAGRAEGVRAAAKK
jgi:hypothetical protein